MNLFEFTDEFHATIDRWDGTIGAPSPKNRTINRIRVYKNPFVEHVLASSHPILPGLWFGWAVVLGVYLIVDSGERWATHLSWFLAGALAFSLVEYLIHRFAFHFDPGQERKKRIRLFLMHGLHHEFPNDKWRLVAPPLMSWPIAIVLFFVFWLVFRSELTFVVFGGTCLGYLFYDWTHYYTHHRRHPKTRLGKLLRRSHAVHHYKLFHLNMGISSPLWDFLFGTYAWSEEAMKAALRETREVEAQTSAAESRGAR